jgi:hypothetical protein
MPRPEAQVRAIDAHVTCGHEHEVIVTNPRLSAYGGCHGYHGDDEYCYCDLAVVELSFECPVCEKTGVHMWWSVELER